MQLLGIWFLYIVWAVFFQLYFVFHWKSIDGIQHVLLQISDNYGYYIAVVDCTCECQFFIDKRRKYDVASNRNQRKTKSLFAIKLKCFFPYWWMRWKCRNQWEWKSVFIFSNKKSECLRKEGRLWFCWGMHIQMEATIRSV